jgi:predicted TIM-barrel fold metal-dependent hydrolase
MGENMTAEALSWIVSGDTHLEVDSKAFLDWVPKEYRDRAPHLIRLPNGGDAWMIEGAPLQDLMFTLYAGKGRDTFRPFGQTYEGSVGTGPPEQRLGEQDADNIDAEVIFTGTSGPRFWRHIRDDDCYRAVVHAYNAYMAEEYCLADPARLLGVGVLPWTNLADAIAEMTYCAERGLRAVMLGVFPNGSGAPSPEDDEFWAAALDLDIVVTAHVEMNRERGGQLPKLINLSDTSERSRRSLPSYMPITQQITRFARHGAFNAMQLAMTGVFDRFPGLRIFFAENSIGWLPMFMDTADMYFHRHAHWV